jgi:hypothetical protein
MRFRCLPLSCAFLGGSVQVRDKVLTLYEPPLLLGTRPASIATWSSISSVAWRMAALGPPFLVFQKWLQVLVLMATLSTWNVLHLAREQRQEELSLLRHTMDAASRLSGKDSSLPAWKVPGPPATSTRVTKTATGLIYVPAGSEHAQHARAVRSRRKIHAPHPKQLKKLVSKSSILVPHSLATSTKHASLPLTLGCKAELVVVVGVPHTLSRLPNTQYQLGSFWVPTTDPAPSTSSEHSELGECGVLGFGAAGRGNL